MCAVWKDNGVQLLCPWPYNLCDIVNRCWCCCCFRHCCRRRCRHRCCCCCCRHVRTKVTVEWINWMRQNANENTRAEHIQLCDAFICPQLCFHYCHIMVTKAHVYDQFNQNNKKKCMEAFSYLVSVFFYIDYL